MKAKHRSVSERRYLSVKKKIILAAVAVLLLAVLAKGFFSPPVFLRLTGKGVTMEGNTGRVFRVPLTGMEKLRLAAGCLFARKIGMEDLAEVTGGGNAQDLVVVNLAEDTRGGDTRVPYLMLSYYPGKNVTVMYYADQESGAESYWAVGGKLARRLSEHWRSEFDKTAQ
jgi:hypothetical protein